MAKNPKNPVTCEVYIDNKLYRVFYENRVIYSDAKGKFVRDQDRHKHYLNYNNTYRIDWRSVKAVKASDLLNKLTNNL